MKKWLVEVLKAVVIAVLSAIATVLITGQPLTGISKLAALGQALSKRTVPAWAFALALFVAVFGLFEIVVRFRKDRRPIGKVHFVPDAHNYGWAGDDVRTDLRAGGTFTYDGIGVLTVVNAFLKGTEPQANMMAAVVTSDGFGDLVSVPHLDLLAHIPVQAVLNLWLPPVRAERGKPLRGQLVLRDPYNKDHYVGAVDFPWIGGQLPKKV